MTKNIKLLAFIGMLSLLLSFITSVNAEDVNYNSIAPVEDFTQEQSERVKQYLIQDGERVYFDYDRALQNRESDELINIGLLIETISEEYSNSTFTPNSYFRSIPIPFHGNYCGPGHNGNNFTLPITDVLDQGCQNHDRCFTGMGYRKNCECNRQLVEYIRINRRWIPADVRWKADAIKVYFETAGLIGC